MTIVDEHDEGGPMSVREHHLVVATAKHVFLHREYGVVFVREAASREDLAAYDLTPLLLYGLSVPGTSLRWVMLTPVDNPACQSARKPDPLSAPNVDPCLGH
jgi:hypothetical protein